jgi:hypothetical protein
VATTLASASLDAQQRSPAVVRGFATLGSITFHAQDSFDAVFDRHSGPVFGGGGQVLLPSGIYIEVAASRFTQDGERAFVTATGEVFRLGIPVDLTITPLEITGGWRFRKWRRVVPYGGAGYSSYRYQETSEFADPEENVDARFSGFTSSEGRSFSRGAGWRSAAKCRGRRSRTRWEAAASRPHLAKTTSGARPSA